jgi:hypothetical protein
VSGLLSPVVRTELASVSTGLVVESIDHAGNVTTREAFTGWSLLQREFQNHEVYESPEGSLLYVGEIILAPTVERHGRNVAVLTSHRLMLSTKKPGLEPEGNQTKEAAV